MSSLTSRGKNCFVSFKMAILTSRLHHACIILINIVSLISKIRRHLRIHVTTRDTSLINQELFVGFVCVPSLSLSRVLSMNGIYFVHFLNILTEISVCVYSYIFYS